MNAIIFDLDGTLIDSAPDLRAAANAMLAEFGAPPLTLDEVRGFIGNGVPKLVERCLAARGIDPAVHLDAVARFSAHYDVAPAALTVLYPGARTALQVLARSHPLGLCTNKPEAPARKLLTHFGLETLFGAVIGGDSLPVRKPDPAPLIAARDALGAAAAVYVGDSEVDAETAQAAAMPFALFTGGYRKTPVSGIAHWRAFAAHDALPGLILRDAA
ncbi:phosphoglycolate phosphatase [Rhodobacteraceae bacterium 2CG4]|uniref:Phosphoglycolate phosphatase n=1 Tax=Halovulum marinum TaxID=2662447 RepID=A0A6L5Z0Y8_9RHOB|nr:phosphoglycolate phosphatase [Halovulum marinum]MSU90158.1 phosphoglycolate phosphatase [Halovulum marinum]